MVLKALLYILSHTDVEHFFIGIMEAIKRKYNIALIFISFEISNEYIIRNTSKLYLTFQYKYVKIKGN